MRILVLVKHVPEPTATWRFSSDLTLDRAGVDGRLSQLDEHAAEQALRLAEGGHATGVTFLTMGPAAAAESLRKALAMGGDGAVHVLDEALRGSDALTTSMVLAKAIERTGFDLVICGMASTDAEMSVIPSMVAERLGVPQVTNCSALAAASDGSGSLAVHRETDAVSEELVLPLPAVVSVTDQSGEPRYPSFKGIMAARKKSIETLSLSDLGIAQSSVGTAGAATVVEDVHPVPPRSAGTVITDEGDAAARLADFLAQSRLL